MRRTAVVIFLAVFAAGTIVYSIPWWTDQRRVVTANPTLESIGDRSLITVPAGGRACVAPVPFGPTTDRVQVIVHLAKQPQAAPPLRVEAGAAGYHATGRLPAYPANVDDSRLEAPIPPAPRRVEGTLCLVPEGSKPIQLAGTREPPSQTRAITTVNGRDLGEQDLTVTLLESRPRAVADRAGTIMARISGLTGGLVPTWLLWPFGVLVAVGMPVLVAVAYVRALPR